MRARAHCAADANPSAQNQTAPSASRGGAALGLGRGPRGGAVMHRWSDLPKSEAAFELPSSRRHAAADELRK